MMTMMTDYGLRITDYDDDERERRDDANTSTMPVDHRSDNKENLVDYYKTESGMG
jgi:hypothetical protein